MFSCAYFNNNILSNEQQRYLIQHSMWYGFATPSRLYPRAEPRGFTLQVNKIKRLWRSLFISITDCAYSTMQFRTLGKNLSKPQS